MSHENPMMTGYSASLAADVLRDLRAEGDGLEETQEFTTAEAFHETGSTPAIRTYKQQSVPSWAREDFDPLTSPYVLVQQERREAEAQQKHARIGIREELNTWSLLGLRSMQGYRNMRPEETNAEFIEPLLGDQIARERGLGSFALFNEQLRSDIEDLGDFDFHNVKTRPKPIPEEAPLAEAPADAELSPQPQEDHPTLNMQVPRFSTKQAPPPAKPLRVVSLSEAFPSPTPSGNATIERLAQESPLAQTEQAVSVGPENLERIDPPVIPEFAAIDATVPAAEASSERSSESGEPEATKTLPAAPVRQAIESAPAPVGSQAQAYEQQLGALTEQIAEVYDINPFEVSLRGLEKGVENFLGRHKKAARIAEYAGAAVLAAAAGSRLLRRFRGRR